MPDEFEAKITRNALLQGFDIGIGKFDYASARDIQQMIVMTMQRCLVSSTPKTEIMALEDALGREKFECSINGR